MCFCSSIRAYIMYIVCDKPLFLKTHKDQQEICMGKVEIGIVLIYSLNRVSSLQCLCKEVVPKRGQRIKKKLFEIYIF